MRAWYSVRLKNNINVIKALIAWNFTCTYRVKEIVANKSEATAGHQRHSGSSYCRLRIRFCKCYIYEYTWTLVFCFWWQTRVTSSRAPSSCCLSRSGCYIIIIALRHNVRNDWWGILRKNRLLRSERHRAMIMPVSLLHLPDSYISWGHW